jgi:hypothetical protein
VHGFPEKRILTAEAAKVAEKTEKAIFVSACSALFAV